MDAITESIERVATAVVNAAYSVHRRLGPGLLESVYEICLAHELRKSGLGVRSQVAVPVMYDGLQLDAGFRIDLLVGESVIVELKAIERLMPVHTAQVLTYLKLTGYRLGFLINFNVELIKQGIKRIAL
ncbi:MAG TPA: GxxExxY protein [Terriglobales bacterium]|nr:GxxExxY protein [Terriglobales bacterium]